MEFDITNIDRKVLLKAVFEFATPIGVGVAEYFVKKENGENVDSLTDDECDEILYQFNTSSSNKHIRILDYYKGKPMKLIFYKAKNGKISVQSDRYDSRNGKYRFLEAMLNYFSVSEVLILKKGYNRDIMSELPEHLVKTKEQESLFTNLLKNAIMKENKYGKYWELPPR
ncbi:MAG: hypothetical protein LBJ63_05060 [Prevotellaceae bacterium]|jgi:hypothetical protein|nr:hypothetical protein [Prevotellaceae bacterium]